MPWTSQFTSNCVTKQRSPVKLQANSVNFFHLIKNFSNFANPSPAKKWRKNNPSIQLCALHNKSKQLLPLFQELNGEGQENENEPAEVKDSNADEKRKSSSLGAGNNGPNSLTTEKNAVRFMRITTTFATRPT